MNTKRLLSLFALIILAAAVVFAYLIRQSFQDYDQALRNESVANQIATTIFDRRLLADDYLMNPTDRAKTQWYRKQSEVVALIHTQGKYFTSAKEKDELAQIQNGLTQSAVTFKEVTNSFGTGSNIPEDIAAAQKARYSAQLSIFSLNTEAATNDLLAINRSMASSALHKIVVLFSILASVFLGLLAISFLVIRRSINRLEHREAEDAAILGSIGDGVFALDKQGKVILFNRAAETLTGLDRKEVMGTDYRQTFHFVNEKDHQPALEFIRSALSGKPQSMPPHTLLKRKDDSIPVADSASPIINKQGATTGAVVVFRDITAERQIERTKNEFISLAAHQLKTPPTAMKWNLELLLDGTTGSLNAGQKDILKTLDTTNEGMIEVVNSLLNVSRVELGTFIVEPQPVDFMTLTKAVLQEQQKSITTKDLRVTQTYPPELPRIPADPGLAKIMIENVVSNAVKYTPNKGAIEINLVNMGTFLHIEVADTGFGIPKHQQAKIFTKMFRADNVKKIDGTGFGLYLLKIIVEDVAKGKIWFESTEGKGTTFYIEIPLSGMTPRKGSSHLSSIKIA